MAIFEKLFDNLKSSKLKELKEKKQEGTIDGISKNIIESCINEIADKTYSQFKNNTPKILDEQKTITDSFVVRNNGVWSSEFDKLEMLIYICCEASENFFNSYEETEGSKNDMVFYAVKRLHARACNIAKEILWLLRGGYADGAEARWRSLYEVFIITSFLCDHNNELATRYINYEAVEKYQAMNQLIKYNQRLNFEPFEVAEHDVIKKNYDMVITKYGKDFKNRNAWASEILKNKAPSFSHIEESINFDHMRPFYKQASYNVHAGASRLFYNLGVLDEKAVGIHAGPSSFGIAGPIDQTALTMSQITTRLLNLSSSIDNIVFMNIIDKLNNDIRSLLIKSSKN